jgi:cytochrome c peroxidase
MTRPTNTALWRVEFGERSARMLWSHHPWRGVGTGFLCVGLFATFAIGDSEHSDPAMPNAVERDKEAIAETTTASEAERTALRSRARRIFGVLPNEAVSATHSITEAKVELGRFLYYEPRLSKNHDIACNSCHLLAEYGVDHEPTSTGHRGQRGGRNAPTVYNAAFHIAQFWDGRAADVEEQARGPILNPIEMAMASEEDAVAVLRSIPGYRPLFEAAFPDAEDPITYDHLVFAIGAFERRLVTPSRFDDFLDDQPEALSNEELLGLSAFIDTGCPTCHMGSTLGGTLYQRLGLVHPYETQDLGRYELTGNDADRYFFKVPSLRNVAETYPYFHDGSIGELEEAIRLMAYHQLGKELSASKIEEIAAFLRSLTGRIAESYIARPEPLLSGADTPDPDPS